VTEAGGRVVKLIGDEAMFVGPSAQGAVRGALELVEACKASGLPAARAGLALGPVLARGGDYFGRAVNLASRLVDAAPAGAVRGDERLVDAIPADSMLAIEQRGRESLKGLGTVEVWSLGLRRP
jgi:adenylate cyclase